MASWNPAHVPSIDVFLPSAGEDLAVLSNTYRHVSALQWRGEVNVLVLDDSAREDVRRLAHGHGFTYLSRPNRGWFKKAGNLRYAFEHSAGDVILVLDADFVPRPDALTELVPYLDDPEIGIVQSPQYFDSHSRMNWIQRAAGATQILFYRWVQPSRDRSRAAICVGTSALYRRARPRRRRRLRAHRTQRGRPHRRQPDASRLRGQVCPDVVTKGLCPDTIDQFATQQYRWCTGSMSLLFSRGFHRLPLTSMQRLSYWSGFLYYITTAVNVFVTAVPPILMGWFAPGLVRPANFVFVVLAMVGRQSIVPFITLERASLVGLARIQTTYSFCHALALSDVLRRRTDAWVATGTGGRSRTATRLRRLARVWCVAVQVLLWGAILLRTPEYGLGQYWLMIAFAVLNLVIVLPLVLGRTEPLLPRRRALEV